MGTFVLTTVIFKNGGNKCRRSQVIVYLKSGSLRIHYRIPQLLLCMPYLLRYGDNCFILLIMASNLGAAKSIAPSPLSRHRRRVRGMEASRRILTPLFGTGACEGMAHLRGTTQTSRAAAKRANLAAATRTVAKRANLAAAFVSPPGSLASPPFVSPPPDSLASPPLVSTAIIAPVLGANAHVTRTNPGFSAVTLAGGCSRLPRRNVGVQFGIFVTRVQHAQWPAATPWVPREHWWSSHRPCICVSLRGQSLPPTRLHRRQRVRTE